LRMHSLASRHPWRLDVPLLLSASLVLLAEGLTRPALQITAFIFWRSEFSILENIQRLYEGDRRSAGIVLAACSVAYPVTKITLLFAMWLLPAPARWRRGCVRLLRLLGRWSMLDVLAITALVVGSRSIFLVEAEPLAGIYVYAAAIVLLMLATVLMDRLAGNGR